MSLSLVFLQNQPLNEISEYHTNKSILPVQALIDSDVIELAVDVIIVRISCFVGFVTGGTIVMRYSIGC